MLHDHNDVFNYIKSINNNIPKNNKNAPIAEDETSLRVETDELGVYLIFSIIMDNYNGSRHKKVKLMVLLSPKLLGQNDQVNHIFLDIAN